MALGYVEAARRYAIMSPRDFFLQHGEVQRALAYLDEPAASAAQRIHDLHQRHGAAVLAALDGLLAGAEASMDPDSLAVLVGVERQDSRERPASLGERQVEDRPRRDLALTLSRCRRAAVLSTLGELKNTDFEVIATLTEPFLEAAGKGLASEDYPMMTSRQLAGRWNVSEPTVRRRINRLRRSLEELAEASQRPSLAVDEVVENIPWSGYRLNPDRVRVIIAD